jgi:hypothetical protein
MEIFRTDELYDELINGKDKVFFKVVQKKLVVLLTHKGRREPKRLFADLGRVF